jgi:hypothetical protein
MCLPTDAKVCAAFRLGGCLEASARCLGLRSIFDVHVGVESCITGFQEAFLKG